jgi:DNA-directed RNA polymerase subunit RPC12/RpoP
MSEFNFNCPACGKNIKCESWRSNTMMECPMCFQRIIVPKAPEIDDLELIIKGSKATRRLMTRPEIGSGTPTAPPAKGVPVAAIAFVVLLCAVIAAMFIFRGQIFKPTEEPTNPTMPPVVKETKPTPPPAPIKPKPIVGLASIIFNKGDSMVVKDETTEAEVTDPDKAAFLAAFKADLASPLAFEDPGELVGMYQGGRVVPGATGAIPYHSSFKGGLVIGVTLQGLVPGHDYVLTLNGDPQRAGNNNLPDRVSGGNGQKCYDFNRITTDATGSYHATFCIKLPAGQYDVCFFVKDPTDWKIVLQHTFFQFTVE